MKTQKVVSREYKLMLQAAKFAGPEKHLLAVADQLWEELVEAITPFVVRIDGALDTISKQRLVAFGGIRSTNPGETLIGEMAYATSGNGRAWALGPGSLTETTYTSTYGTAAVDDGGTPFVASIGTSTNQVTLHRGIDTSRPASGGDYLTKSGTFGTYAYHVGLAQNAKSKQIWCSWYSNAAETSIFAAESRNWRISP